METINETRIYDMLIIGGGPAGYTAALYAARGGLSVAVVEKMSIGGQMALTDIIDNYPGFEEGVEGFILGMKMQAGAERFGAETIYAEVTKVSLEGDVKRVVTTDSVLYARTVVVATGADPRALLPGEEAYIGRGLHYCAHCDGRFYKGKEVIVVGGGNTAVQDALVLAELCSHVYLIHRRDGFRAEAHLLERLRKAENVTLLTDTVVTEMRGEWALSSLLLQNVKSGEMRELEVAGVFEAVGVLPRNDAFRELVTLDADGYVSAGEDCRTSARGIFAAGDCRTKAIRQLTTAVADGTVAALGAVELLAEEA